MTVNELRELLQPLYDLTPIEVELIPCPLPRPNYGNSRKDMAQIVGIRIANYTQRVILQVQREHDC